MSPTWLAAYAGFVVGLFVGATLAFIFVEYIDNKIRKEQKEKKK